MHLCCYEAKQRNLKLKTQPTQLFGYLPLALTALKGFKQKAMILHEK